MHRFITHHSGAIKIGVLVSALVSVAALFLVFYTNFLPRSQKAREIPLAHASHAGRLWIFGAESGLAAEAKVNTGAPAISTATVRSGAYSLQTNGSDVSFVAVPNYPGQASMYSRSYLNFVALPSVANVLVQSNAGGVGVSTLMMLTDGKLEARNGNSSGPVVGTSTTALAPNNWYRIDLKTVVSATAGIIEVRINGTVVISASSLNTGTSNITGVGYGPRLTAQNIFWDDIIEDSTGYPGDGKIIARQPKTGAPTYDQWTKVGTDPYWADTPPSTVNRANAEGSATPFKQTKLIASFSSTQTGHGAETIDANDSLNSTTVRYFQKTGTGPDNTYEMLQRVGGADTLTAVTLTASDAFYDGPHTEPTLTNLNGMEAGGSMTGTAVPDYTIEDLWVMVDYTPSNSLLAQRGYIFENDDGTGAGAVDGDTQIAAGNTAITSVKKGERLTLRMQLNNTGGPLESSKNLSLFYDRNDGIWTKVEDEPVITATGDCDHPTDGAKFDCMRIDGNTTDVGGWLSMAIDPTGNPWISFMDVGNTNLNVARYVGQGGDCDHPTDGGKWDCMRIDGNTTDVGRWSSIAFDPTTGNPWISFYDNETTNKNLKVAKYVGSGGDCDVTADGAKWDCMVVDATNDVGRHSSLVFTSAGTAWISFYDLTNNTLRVAKYVGSGGDCTGVDGALWDCMVVATVAGAEMESSIAIDVAGSPWVAFYRHRPAGTCTGADECELQVARYVGSGGDCTGTDGALWDCMKIDATGDAGKYNSIAFDPSGTPWISFYRGDDNVNGTCEAGECDLYMAKYLNGATTGDCTHATDGNKWDCMQVDVTGNVGEFPSIAFDPAGNPWVSFRDFTSSDGNLNIARYVGSGGDCTGTDGAAWDCMRIDGNTTNVGSYGSLAFDPSGNAWIGFRDSTNGNLNAARFLRGGEIQIAPGQAGANGATLAESHSDMTTTSDTANRDDADCLTTGAAWNNGKWFKQEYVNGVSLPQGSGTTQCTEIAFTIDTLSATEGQQYRFVIASNDNWRTDKGTWRGPAAITNYPTLTIVGTSANTIRVSKDAIPAFDTNCSDTSWQCETIDNAASLAEFTDIATDRNTGKTWAIYHDAAGDWKIAEHVGGNAGNCDSNNNWNCAILDNSPTFDCGVSGTPDNRCSSSLVIDQDGYPWAVYYETTNNDLKVARYKGPTATGGTCTDAKWDCFIVDDSVTAADSANGIDAAFHPLTGQLWIVYHTEVDGSLKFMRYTGASSDKCTATSATGWLCYTLSNIGSDGWNPAIAFDSAGKAWVSHGDGTNDDFYIAQYVGSGGTGCTGGSAEWTCTLLKNSSGIGNASDTTLAIDSANVKWSLFYDPALSIGGGISAANSQDLGTNCTDTTWQCWSVDTTSTSFYRPEAIIDGRDKAWMVRVTAETNDLEFVRYVASGGNCASSAAWSCGSIDSTVATIGRYASVDKDAYGNFKVSYQDTTNTALRMAFRKDMVAKTDALASLDSKGYANVASADDVRDEISGTEHIPFFYGAFRFTSNTSAPVADWEGHSTVAATASIPIRLQVYRIGTTNDWETVASATSGCLAPTDCTLGTGSWTPAGPVAEYYEADGANYWARFRVVQDGTVNATLRTDLFRGAAALSNVQQQKYRWRNDNGTESAATDKAAENTSVSGQGKLENLRLRILLSNEGTAAKSSSYTLQYATLAGAACGGGDETFANVPVTPTTEPVEMVTSANYVDQDPSTNLSGNGSLTDPAGTFVAGKLVEDPSAAASSLTLNGSDLGKQFTELEYAIQFTSNATDGATYCFKTTGLDTADPGTATAQIRITQSPSVPSSLAPAVLITGGYSGSNNPSFTFSLSDPDSGQQVRYCIEIDDSSDFASPVVRHFSALAAQGSFSYQVGAQASAAGTGCTPAVGALSQTLPDSVPATNTNVYYWRVKAQDAGGAESAWSTANLNGTTQFISFFVDTAATRTTRQIEIPILFGTTLQAYDSTTNGTGTSGTSQCFAVPMTNSSPKVRSALLELSGLAVNSTANPTGSIAMQLRRDVNPQDASCTDTVVGSTTTANWFNPSFSINIGTGVTPFLVRYHAFREGVCLDCQSVNNLASGTYYYKLYLENVTTGQALYGVTGRLILTYDY